MHKNAVKGLDQDIYKKFLQKMEPLIWNTYAADRVTFRIGGFTAVHGFTPLFLFASQHY